MRLLILTGAVLLFLALWLWFFYEIWSKDDTPVDLNQRALYVAGLLGGILGTFFGVSLGVERKDPKKDTRRLTPGATLLGTQEDDKGAPEAVATAAVWVYALVGAAAVASVMLRSAQCPGAVETLATTFGGFLLAIVTAAFAPGQTLNSAKNGA